ncbi:MAG: DnaD domain protein, partial [Chloroflexi bacterium]|nr:DnaD domain protein [Chloroflexota bacterium]
ASDEAARQALAEGLERAVQRSTLLKASVSEGETGMEVYFLNSPRGRAAVEAIQQGQWTPGEQPRLPVNLELERPNVYRLYEENIGPLTPLIADALQEAEKLYPGEWIEDAVRIAVENNVRRWRYVERILQSWKEKGRDETDRRNLEEDRRKYVEGEFAEFIEH